MGSTNGGLVVFGGGGGGRGRFCKSNTANRMGEKECYVYQNFLITNT